jgi:hypothetical protein
MMVFGKNNSLVKKKCEMVHCRDATSNSFFAKVRVKVFTHFHAVVVKHYSIMQN